MRGRNLGIHGKIQYGIIRPESRPWRPVENAFNCAFFHNRIRQLKIENVNFLTMSFPGKSCRLRIISHMKKNEKGAFAPFRHFGLFCQSVRIMSANVGKCQEI